MSKNISWNNSYDVLDGVCEDLPGPDVVRSLEKPEAQT